MESVTWVQILTEAVNVSLQDNALKECLNPSFLGYLALARQLIKEKENSMSIKVVHTL